MLARERQRQILDLLAVSGSVKVTDLAARFEVTDETIRRDLDRLGAEGRLERSHGGALAAQELEQPHWQREFVNEEAKEAMAREAVKLVHEGDSLALDASSTCWFLARRLPDIPLTVITYALPVCTILQGREHIEVICAGGRLAETTLSFVGPATLDALQRYHADRLFLSCRGLDLQSGLSDINEEQAKIRQRMMDLSDQRIMMMDSSKWGHRALARVAPIESFSTLITDEGADPEQCRDLEARGLHVTRAAVIPHR